MRITNTMISNSSRSHIANAKNELLNRENQYTTQKKIQRPSDDPTIAIRSLQLRTTYSQLGQFVERNVQDGMKWMDTTETAIKNINDILTSMKDKLNNGVMDDLGSDDRRSIVSVLQQFAAGIFEDEADTDYSGRYVFTGYRTDTSLLFPEKTENLEYEIVENLDSKSIDTIKYVTSGARYKAGTSAADYATQVPKQGKAYRMQLSYANCADSQITGSSTPAIQIKLTHGGTTETLTPSGTQSDPTNKKIVVMKSTDTNAYDPDTAGADAIFLADTGEVVFSKAVYESIQENSSQIEVTYAKKEFDKGDIRPEMYFECKSYNTTSAKETVYREPSDQQIKYEINFSQTSVVNIQARDAISTQIYRAIDYIDQTVTAVENVEKRIGEVETLIANTTDKTELAAYNKLKEMLETEKRLRVGSVTEAFGMGLTMVDETQDQLNVSLAELGSRYNRLELTYDKLLDQRVDTEEKLSDNEDVDIADAYINLTQADNLYQASLSATAKILGNSLLNYI